jgi:hypothetical protein
MNKKSLKLLEQVFLCEINSALSKDGIGLFQTKNKLADQLVSEGYLERKTVLLPGRFPVSISGYELTHLGRFTYCASCDDEPLEAL